MAPSLDSMLVLAKQFDTQNFRTLFGLGWGAESTLLSISLYLSPQTEKLAPSLDIMLVLAKQFDSQNFRTLFGLGWGAESTLLSITL